MKLGRTFPRGFSQETDFAWPLIRAGELVALNYGKALVEKNRRPGDVPVYGTNGQCGWHDESLAAGPTVILGRKGMGNLGVEWCNRDFWVIDTAYYVTGKNGDLDLKFFYYLIDYIGLNHLKDGTSNPSLSRDTFAVQLLPCPPLVVQRAITKILGSLDDKIELNRRMNETLEEMAKAIFKSWFVDFDPVRAKAAGRQPAGMDAATAALFPDRFEDSPLGKIPKGWSVAPVPEAFEVNPSRSLSKCGPAPYLDMAGMPTRSARAVDWTIREVGSGMKFINGDVLVARITPCLENGKTAFVDFLADRQVGWGSTEYIVLRSKPPLPVEYAYFVARSEDFRSHAITNMTGTTGRQRVPATCLDSFNVVVPPRLVAERFGQIASSAIAVLKRHDEESCTLAAVRDALLPKLLSGEVRVGAIEREVVSHA